MTISTASCRVDREVEIEDPIDYADLPYAEDVCAGVCDQVRDIAERAEELARRPL